MAVINHYEPWTWLTQLQNELERSRTPAAVDGSTVETAQWAPAVDIKEEKDRFLLQADLPGIKPDDIDITMEKGLLTIKGERNTEANDTGDGYARIERKHGSFYRRFSLPDTTDEAGITAVSNHGVLEISIPKAVEVQPKKIAVTS